MGIKGGSGKGGVDRGGSKADGPVGVGSSRKRNKSMGLPPPPPRKPLQPDTTSPFPEKKDFRLGQYRVIEERGDYLLCTGYDPNAKNPFSEVTPSAFRTGELLKIAKPPALQQTPWEGGATIGGVAYTFEYTGMGLRTARWTDDDGNDQEEEQGIGIPYVVEGVGDIIVAVQIRKNAAVDGMEFTDEEGTRLRWMDLNVSGRHWSTASVASETSMQVIRFAITSGSGSSVFATVQGSGCGYSDEGTVTVYDALGCFFDETAAALVGRKGYAIQMKSGDDCRYEVFSLCCPT
jgi:hypothetical protein